MKHIAVMNNSRWNWQKQVNTQMARKGFKCEWHTTLSGKIKQKPDLVIICYDSYSDDRKQVIRDWKTKYKVPVAIAITVEKQEDAKTFIDNGADAILYIVPGDTLGQQIIGTFNTMFSMLQKQIPHS